ncbi:MAG TPA: VCBS repeat-containing protein [Ohtaekwangia sp.]
MTILLVTVRCNPEKGSSPAETNDTLLFQRLSTTETGITFKNELTVSEDFNVFKYRNFYNGGGVGIGDINNDGLPDIYFTSNMGDNKLYLNKGNWKFEDITEKAGVKGSKIWSTGVSIADVNADGFLDLYVCNAGDPNGDNRENELFINNGDLTFTERAKGYGLADKGFSTHAVFFDYDKDGDLDCYVLNNSGRPISTLGYRNLRHERDEFGGHKLYRNNNDHFVDVSEEAGIYGSVIGFGLGVMVGDVNQDNWPDLYVSNDFYERDYLYVNNHDGTFTESLEERLGHISMFSMGADLADLNNDGYPDIFSTDMLPDDDYRLKTLVSFETYDIAQLRLKNGYYHQYMRNMLQMNNGDGSFMEVAELAGVAATDWSWGALMADFDNDMHREIFVSNGIFKDVTNQDFVEFLGSSDQVRAVMEGKKVDFIEFVNKMSSQKIHNHMFTAAGELNYTDVALPWGLDEPSFSNGAAYGDLDGDGDLDLVINNVNQEAFVYRNQVRELKRNNFIAITFKGVPKNTFGLGASVHATVGREKLLFDQMPIRGFQSSMDYKMVIGIGQASTVDSLAVIWPDNRMQVFKNVSANQTLTVSQTEANWLWRKEETSGNALLKEVQVSPPVVHQENEFNDFDRDRLLYHMLSTQGPAFAKADLNNDGLDDFYLGGSAGISGAIYIQQKLNKFSKFPTSVFEPAALSEDVDAVFFDADKDGDLDLYVVSGGSEYIAQSPHNLDHFYLNTGSATRPVFVSAPDHIPAFNQSGSCVRPADIDQDGDLDLFVGTRVLPAYYGIPCDQFILINDGKGNFADGTALWASPFKKLGMVTDAQWFDYDQNGFLDLILVGEWMPVTIFKNDGKHLTRVENLKGLDKTEGWWNTIEAVDLNRDGNMDFVLGNIGLNSKFKPSAENPLSLYVGDFDLNSSLEPVFTFQKEGKEYPLALRQDMIRQMTSLKKNFLYYKDYAGKTIEEIIEPKLLREATRLNFYEPRSCILVNQGFDFILEPLPVHAQVSPVYDIEVHDLNKDGHLDLILAGNLYGVKPEAGRYDALQGLVLTGNGTGKFIPNSFRQSGLKITGEVRHISLMNAKNPQIAFIRNNDSIKLYSINP